MKKIFSITYNKGLFDIWILLLRIFAGAFMLTHGLPKFELLISGAEINFPDPIGLGSEFSFVLIVFAEFFCSVLLIAGFGTRLTVIPLIISMSVAVFLFHGNDPFAARELGLMYLLIYFTLLITGGGKYSADYFISRRNKV